MGVMRLIMVAGMLVLLACQDSLAVILEEVKHERHPLVVALPEFARIGKGRDTVLLMRGRFSKARAAELVKQTRILQEDVKRRFLRNRDKSGQRPVDVCLFATARSYRDFVGRVMKGGDYGRDRGIFAPYQRLVAVDLSGGEGPLRHELAHALLRDDLGVLPDWLDEGIASLYVSVKPTGSGLEFLADHRLEQLRALKAAGKLPGLDKLSGIDDREMYGPDYLAYYTLSRFLLLYLDRRGKLKTFMKTMLSKPGKPAWQLAVLERFIDTDAFLAWTEKL